jgi:hypothetical protein
MVATSHLGDCISHAYPPQSPSCVVTTSTMRIYEIFTEIAISVFSKLRLASHLGHCGSEIGCRRSREIFEIKSRASTTFESARFVTRAHVGETLDLGDRVAREAAVRACVCTVRCSRCVAHGASLTVCRSRCVAHGALLTKRCSQSVAHGASLTVRRSQCVAHRRRWPIGTLLTVRCSRCVVCRGHRDLQSVLVRATECAHAHTRHEHSGACRCLLHACRSRCQACTCTTYSEHVGTSTASAARMPDGGAEQRQRRHGKHGRPGGKRPPCDIERGSIPRFCKVLNARSDVACLLYI